MRQSLFRVTAVVALAALSITTSEASTRRKSFFEQLFGTKEERQQRKIERERRRAAFRPWWEEDNDVRFIFDEPVQKKKKNKKPLEAKKKLAAAVAAADRNEPEPLPGFGLGNLSYVQAKLLPVRESALSSATANGADATAIRVVLSDKQTPIRSSAKIRDAVIGFYKDRSFKPVWTEAGKPSRRAEELLKFLSASSADGLDPMRYLPAVLNSYDNVTEQIEGSALAAAQFDVGLTVAALSYADHMSGGQFDPKKLSLYHDLRPDPVSPTTAVKVLAFSPFAVDYLKSLAPTHYAYGIMKAELHRLNTVATSVAPFPEGKRVKIGQKDDRIVQLRGRMIELGFYDQTQPRPEGSTPDTLDKLLGKSLKAFQASRRIPQTSALDSATVKALNTDTAELDRERLAINMERLRWLPKNLGNKHVFVNQASYQVEVFEKGYRIWQSKVIVGKAITQTNVFSDVMENVVVNPSWGMPPSILINEYLGKLRRDPSYFDRIGYKVIDSNGKVVKSRSVNWNTVTPYSVGVQQPPGKGNALGELKFNFPNSHAIYMHDTPNRELFDQEIRNFSHGCVRVHKPREFASIILGLSLKEIEDKIKSGKSEAIPLKDRVDVHLTYFTAWPDEMGKIRYYSDVYERDATLLRARNIELKAFAPDSRLKLVEANN